MAKDLEYFRKRLTEESVLAQTSETVELRAVHRTFADLYAQRLSALAEKIAAVPYSLRA